MTKPLKVELHPVWTAGGSRGYRYNVTLNGDIIVNLSRDPETDLARALLERGVTGVVKVVDGKSGKPRTSVNIEKAAKLRTVETENAPRFRNVARADAPYAGESLVPGSEIPANSYGSLCTPVEIGFPQENFAAVVDDRGRPRSEAA